MSESTVAEQGSWGRVLAEIPVNVSNSPRTSTAGRKNHEKFGRHSETNTGANSQKGKRKTADFENTFPPGAETSTSKPVQQYQRRKRKSGDGDSPDVAAPPPMPPYTPPGLPPGMSPSLTSGISEVQPSGRHATTTRRQLASPPSATPPHLIASMTLPPGTSTPLETETPDGSRSSLPRVLTGVEGDGVEGPGAPVSKPGGETARREQPARAAKKTVSEMSVGQPGRKSEPGGRRSTRHISENEHHRRASAPPDATLLPSRRSSSTGISQQPASIRLLPDGEIAAPADEPFEFQNPPSPAGRDFVPGSSTPAPAGSRSFPGPDGHLATGRVVGMAGRSLSEDLSAARGSESTPGKLTRSGGKMAKMQHDNDHREFLLQQKVLFADVDAFELEEDDSSTSKESEEMSPTLPPSDKEEEGS